MTAVYKAVLKTAFLFQVVKDCILNNPVAPNHFEQGLQWHVQATGQDQDRLYLPFNLFIANFTNRN